MGRSKLSVAILAACAMAAPSLTAQTPAPPVLTTSGFGRIGIVATRARLTFEVEARSRSAQVAADSNDRRLTAIVARLRTLPYLDSVRVAAIRISPTFEQGYGFTGYDAVATVEARLRDVSKVAPAFDAAITSGATSIGPVRYEGDRVDAARRRALTQAFAAARADAEALAKAAGGHLGRLIRLTTGGGQSWIASNSFEEASVTTEASSAEFGNAQSGIISIATDPGEVVATASVTAQWEILR
jgi:uncharacterized protein YggE